MPKIINGIKCRTREESLRHIMRQAKANKIGPEPTDATRFDNCLYQYPSGNNCGVGCLFDAKQIKDIKAKQMNGMSIKYLSATALIGKKNLEAVTGMAINELDRIQSIHDRALERYDAQTARENLIAYCEKELQELKSLKAKV